jgi:hypothetical protein
MTSPVSRPCSMLRRLPPLPPACRAFSLLALVLCLCGCVGLPAAFQFTPGHSATPAPPFRDPALSIPGAIAAVTVGQTTRAEVLARLGEATVLKFDSGFEVWVYREKLSRVEAARVSPAELVILFAPSGIVTKIRTRPAYPASAT